MKNNFRFIFPRLIGATLIVGIAAFVLATLFKLLIGLLLIGGVIGLIRRMAGGRRNYQFASPQHGQFPGGLGAYSHSQWAGPAPVRADVQHTTIVPIN